MSGLVQRHAGDRRPEAGHRRERRARLDPRAARGRAGDGPHGPAAQRHPRVHDARASRRPSTRSRTRSRSPSRSAPRSRRSTSALPRPRCFEGIGHPFADGEPVHDITFENVQAGHAHRLPLPAREPERRHGHRHVRPVGARARLGDLRRRRPDEPLRGQHRRSEDAHPARHPLGDLRRRAGSARGATQLSRTRSRCSSRCSTPRSAPSSCPRVRTAGCSRPRTASDRTPCTTSRSSTSCATGCRPSKIAFLAERAWARPGCRSLAARLPRRGSLRVRPADRREVAAGVPAALLRVRAVQALGDPERTEGVSGRLALAARRLAGAVGRQRGRVARRAGRRPSRSRASTPSRVNGRWKDGAMARARSSAADPTGSPPRSRSRGPATRCACSRRRPPSAAVCGRPS